MQYVMKPLPDRDVEDYNYSNSLSGVSRIVETPGHLYTKLVEWQYIHRLCAILVL